MLFRSVTPATTTVRPIAVSPFTPSTYTNTQITTYGSGYFNGSTDYIATPNSGASDFGTNDFTVEFWMNAAAAGTYVAIVGTQTVSGATTAGIWRISNRLNSVNGIYFNYTNGTSFTDVTLTTTNYNDGTWHHVAITRASNTLDRKSTRLNSSHIPLSRMPSSA